MSTSTRSGSRSRSTFSRSIRSASIKMYSKFLKQECSPSNFCFYYEHPEDFTRCYFQKTSKIGPLWIAYHSIITLYAACSFIYTVTPPFHLYLSTEEILHKYYIFLTHWTHVFETFYFLLGLGVVLVTAFSDEEDMTASTESAYRKSRMKWYLKFYWGVHTIAAPAAFGVTIIFWVFVFKPDRFPVTVNSLIKHAFNSVIMLIHIIVVAIPVRMLHFYLPLCYGLAYSIFSAVYQLSGGTGTKGDIPIYAILDWRNPIKTTVVCTLCIVLIVILHFVLYAVYYIKCYAKKRSRLENV